MSEFKDIMLILSGAAITVLGLASLLSKKTKGWKKIGIGCILVVFLFLSIDQYIRINKEKNNSNRQIANLEKVVLDINTNLGKTEKAKNDEAQKTAEFLHSLLVDFKITRDSLTNKPVSLVFNTSIRDAKEVNIGPKY